jgi:hypothetical protein
VAQTTHNVESWKVFVKNLKKHYTNIEIFDTICSATGLRQTEAIDLAQNSDLMIVIGGKHSSNTVKLSQGLRLMMQGLILVLAASLPWFNIWAAALPLLIPRIAISLRELRNAKRNPSPDRPAIGWDDEDEEDD